jgi:hypothetical protein
MSEEDTDGEGFEARLRWLAQQLSQSVEHLEEIDLDPIARLTGLDVERARELLHDAGEWLNGQADEVVSEGVMRLSGLFDAISRGPAATPGTGPHPLALPTPGQGLALSALESGRWTVEPGSHVLSTHGEGPAPEDAVGLVGELRARDWINADGEVTLVGHNALKRWMDSSGA